MSSLHEISMDKLRNRAVVRVRDVKSPAPIPFYSRSRIHERTISLRFPGIILKVLRLEVSLYNVYITKQFQSFFAQGVEGGKSVVEVTAKRKTLETFVAILLKNSVSGQIFKDDMNVFLPSDICFTMYTVRV